MGRILSRRPDNGLWGCTCMPTRDLSVKRIRSRGLKQLSSPISWSHRGRAFPSSHHTRVPQPSPLISAREDGDEATPEPRCSALPPASPSPLIAALPAQCSRQSRRVVASPLITAEAPTTAADVRCTPIVSRPSRLFVPQPRLTVAQARGGKRAAGRDFDCGQVAVRIVSRSTGVGLLHAKRHW